jgi:hypothetical protein
MSLAENDIMIDFIFVLPYKQTNAQGNTTATRPGKLAHRDHYRYIDLQEFP